MLAESPGYRKVKDEPYRTCSSEQTVWSPYTIELSVRAVQVVSSGLAPYKLPRALASLLLYQQPSSTTLYYSY